MSATVTGSTVDSTSTAVPSLVRRWAWTALVLALLVGASGAMAWSWASMQRSSAAFADSEVLSGNHLGTGIVDVAVGDRTVPFAAVNMAAGDVATGTLEVVNGGTLPLVFDVTAVSNGGPLLDLLDVVAWHAATSSCAAAPSTADATWRPLADVTEPTAAPPTAAQRLAPGASSLLCLRAELPLTASSAVQGQRLDLLLTVAAVHDVAASERGRPAASEGSAT